ncbi:MAG: hypothetical protein OXE92_09385 [Bacteroidetes bacterium]|nr:hypothetical protein [Bacteroidota bacterium]MCY4205921.1 hypothetical protein [Bacteroidota bacterium]
MKKVIVLSLISVFAVQVHAQFYKKGKVMEDGQWVAPTPERALELIMADTDGTEDPAEAVLLQVYDVLPADELDAFAEELGRIVRDGNYIQSMRAGLALLIASKDHGRGIPYTKSTKILIRMYESLEDPAHPKARKLLSDVYDTGGQDYVRNLFNSSEKPPECEICGGMAIRGGCKDVENPCPNVGTWCQAGEVLVNAGEDRPEEWEELCSGIPKEIRLLMDELFQN